MVDKDAVMGALNQCYDPEIPGISLVELGLIYDVRIEEAKVHVKMTLTAAWCGMGPAMAADARSKVEALEGVEEANVELVWDPPWNPEMITPEGKSKMGY